jgi:hypothetical protein
MSKIMFKSITFTVFLFALLFSKPSFALGKLGHKIVCQLTFEHLAPEKQSTITALLKTMPQQHQALINSYNHNKENKSISFADACTWADTIRRLPEFKVFNAWHYINVSRLHTKIDTQECSENCLPQAIIEHQKTLAQAGDEQTWNKTQALLFLSHWLGDIHQPLHTSFKDDLGGNNVKFSNPETKCNNLHGYWDHCILNKGKDNKLLWLSLLREEWQKSTQPHWQTEQVWQWADESFQIATEPNFHYCHKEAQGGCKKYKGNITLPPEYLTQYQPVMKQRLLQAAQRLTKILEVSL